MDILWTGRAVVNRFAGFLFGVWWVNRSHRSNGTYDHWLSVFGGWLGVNRCWDGVVWGIFRIHYKNHTLSFVFACLFEKMVYKIGLDWYQIGREIL